MRVEDVLARIPYGNLLSAAREAAHTPAWIVGGTLRDLLLNRPLVDIDLATPRAEELARAFAERAGGRPIPMDPERGVWRVAPPDGGYLDFCRFRDHDILGDLAGRDFTMNSIALRLPDDASEGGLLDPFDGVADLEHRILRMTSPHAFVDDPLRILRAFRFIAELHATMETDTWNALNAEVPRLLDTAPERLLAEWWKICAGPFVTTALQGMDEARALGVLFPELQATKGVVQNAYHHLDVWEHQMLATVRMADNLHHPDEAFQDMQPDFAPVLHAPHRRARLVFLALIHDVGKPATRSVSKERVHFYEHERVGADSAAAIGRRLRMSHDDLRAVTMIIRHHMRPLFLYQGFRKGNLSRRAMTKFFEDTGAYALDVMALALADKAASLGPAAEPDVEERLREMYRVLLAFYRGYYQPAIAHPLLTGRDLIDEVGIAPGPAIGRQIRRLRELQAEGKLRTREDALRWARHMSITSS